MLAVTSTTGVRAHAPAATSARPRTARRGSPLAVRSVIPPRARARSPGRALARASADDAPPLGPAGTSHVIPGEPAYPGLYCDWSVTPDDVREVWAYRVSLSVVAVSSLVCASSLVLGDAADAALNPAYFLGGSALGAALVLIHMYVDPIKKAMQAMWAAGFAGSLGIALVTHQAVPAYVAQHPLAVWLVGPMFAALTGVAFKEGMCYGKGECAALFFVIPATLLGHLSGLASEGAERGLVGAWMALLAVFAARKYTQEVKDDIGDKSVFLFNALTDEEKEAWMRAARERDPIRYARLTGEL